MTRYYVGIGGNDANAGTTWALRRLTITSGLTLLAVAGDELVVGAGTYRETVTLGAGGAAGVPKLLTGDYLGRLTDGVGGIVRITGSDNDQTATRANCITATTQSYWTIDGFLCEFTTSHVVNLITSCVGITIYRCVLATITPGGVFPIQITGAGQSGIQVLNSVVIVGPSGRGIYINNGAPVANAAMLIAGCLFLGSNASTCIYDTNVGGVTVNGNTFYSGAYGFYNNSAIVGAAISVTNNIFSRCSYGVNTAGALGDIVEDYNTFSGCTTDRTNVAVGAHSVTYPPFYDSRVYLEAMYGGRLTTPYDIASYSQLIGLASGAPATDMRGTGTVGAAREMGALEYDPSLIYRRVFGRNE